MKDFKVEGIRIMNKNILLIADLISQSKNEFVFIWNGLLPSLEDVEILKMITKGSGKEIKIVPLVEIVRNINNKNVTIIQ